MTNVNVGVMPRSSSQGRAPAQSPNKCPWERTSLKGVSARLREPAGAGEGTTGATGSSAWAVAAQPRITRMATTRIALSPGPLIDFGLVDTVLVGIVPAVDL